NSKVNILDKIKSSELFSFKEKGEQSDYYSFAPVRIGKTTTPWSLATVTPTRVILSESKSILTSLLIMGGVGFLLIGFIIWIVAHRLSKVIKQFTNFSNDVNKGDLTSSLNVYRNDELGILAEAMRGMVKSLKELINQIKTNSNNIYQASEFLNKNSQSLSFTASKQASEVEEVSASMEEIGATIEQNAENSETTRHIAIKSEASINESNVASDKAVKSIKAIAEKNSIISEIAFQTNILSLNAAVEAARAGEHGRGFSIVANEVRRLAQLSKEAAEEINRLTDIIVIDAEDAYKKVKAVVPEIQRTASLVEEISTSSKEQSNGVSQINDSISELNNMTQDNAASAENLAASAEELSSQASQLEALINSFKS
ncbi:MAG TPA: methyl-accepting chemotaxis protein, partial [Prolixibacteraceae bacterium]|nr:methyl-accepting chemotaxis protein [Prolixibacteraceae bacterium]